VQVISDLLSQYSLTAVFVQRLADRRGSKRGLTLKKHLLKFLEKNAPVAGAVNKLIRFRKIFYYFPK